MAIKKEVKVTGRLSYEEAVAMMKSFKGSQSIIGEEINVLCKVERYITNIPTLDFLGGVTKSRVNIFAGPKSSGKSTATYILLAKHTREIKESGEIKFVLVWATEGYDAAYASALGVDNKYVVVKRTKVLEEGLKECEEVIRAGFITAMLWDSMDMTVARKSEENLYEACRGSNSGAYSEHLPRFYNVLQEFGVTSYWIKQARLKQGFTGGAEVLVMAGGKIVEHIPDNIYFFKRMSNFNLSYTPVQIKCEKARSSKIGMVLELPLGELGFDLIRDIANLASIVGHLEKSGSWLSFNIKEESIKLQGINNVIDFLKDNPEKLKVFWNDVYDKYILNNPAITFTSPFTMDTEIDSEDNVKTTE